MKVKELREARYNELYRITSFPSQGVELHKTVMSYHFAFNKLISSTDGIHRFPFILDAIFKEDVEEINKEMILKFVKDNRPTDTQTIFSVAMTDNDQVNADMLQRKLGGNTKVIIIGGLYKTRSILYFNVEDYVEMIENTSQIIDVE